MSRCRWPWLSKEILRRMCAQSHRLTCGRAAPPGGHDRAWAGLGSEAHHLGLACKEQGKGRGGGGRQSAPVSNQESQDSGRLCHHVCAPVCSLCRTKMRCIRTPTVSDRFRARLGAFLESRGGSTLGDRLWNATCSENANTLVCTHAAIWSINRPDGCYLEPCRRSSHERHVVQAHSCSLL